MIPTFVEVFGEIRSRVFENGYLNEISLRCPLLLFRVHIDRVQGVSNFLLCG